MGGHEALRDLPALSTVTASHVCIPPSQSLSKLLPEAAGQPAAGRQAGARCCEARRDGAGREEGQVKTTCRGRG